MPNKTYGQLCPIARALDVLGDRWTLLLVRELLLGPKRFKELLATLPAMGTNRLSERLAMLVENGVIRQTTQPLSSTTPAYELTELGEQLREPLVSLGLWGLSLPIDERIEPSSARAELIALCLSGAHDAATSSKLRESYEFHVATEVFHIEVNDGTLRARSGISPVDVAIKVQCDVDAFTDLVLGEISPSRALREHRVTLLQGEKTAFTRAFSVLRYKP